MFRNRELLVLVLDLSLVDCEAHLQQILEAVRLLIWIT